MNAYHLAACVAALAAFPGCNEPRTSVAETSAAETAVAEASKSLAAAERRIDALEAEVAGLKLANAAVEQTKKSAGGQTPPTEAEAKASFLRQMGDQYPYSSLKNHIIHIEFGERQEFMGKVVFPAKVIFQPPGQGPSHARVSFHMGPFKEWECQ